MVIKVLKNKKGAFSILSVIVVFIIVLAITAFTDITSKSYVLNEIQGHMDITGINTLQGSVDTLRLRAEQLATDKNNSIDIETEEILTTDYKTKIDKKYDTEFRKRIGNSKFIVGVAKLNYKIDFTYDVWGFGTSVKKRPQIVLDETYKITIRSSSRFDTITPIAKMMYSARNDAKFSVNYNGTDEDGNVELIVRSVTREVYR